MSTNSAEVVDNNQEKERPVNADVLNLVNQNLSRVQLPDDVTAISTLLLDDNGLTKLENLDAVSYSLRQLSVAGNQIRRVGNLNRLENLTVLNLARNRLTRIDGLRTLGKLTWLNLSENQIQNIENLDGNPELKHLDLSSNAIRALGNLSSCRKLKTLLLHSNSIRTLKSAATLLPRSIAILSLAENELTDLNEVAYLQSHTALEQLSLTGNPCCDQPQIFEIPKRTAAISPSNSPNAANTSGDEDLELEFDYRPFVLNWCMKLQILDGQLVNDKECLKAEWLWTQGRGRHFAIGEHFSVCSYLAKHCPLRPSSAEEDSKLSRILSKREQYRLAVDSGTRNAERVPSAAPYQAGDTRSSKRRLDHSGDISQSQSTVSKAGDTITISDPRSDRDQVAELSPATRQVKQTVAQPQLASDSVYIPVQTASSRGTTQPASRSRTPSSDEQSPMHVAVAAMQQKANVAPAATGAEVTRTSLPPSGSVGSSSAGFAVNRPSAYLPVNVTRLAQGGSNASTLLQLTRASASMSQASQAAPATQSRESEPTATSRKENLDPQIGLLHREAPATLVTAQRSIPNGSQSQSKLHVEPQQQPKSQSRPQALSISGNAATRVETERKAAANANAMASASAGEKAAYLAAQQLTANANEPIANVTALRCIQALFAETNRQIEFVREATRAQQLTLTLLTALIADVAELKVSRRSDAPPPPPPPVAAENSSANDEKAPPSDVDVDAESIVVLREDEAHQIDIQCAAEKCLRVTWPSEPDVSASMSDAVVGYQLLVDDQPVVLAYGRTRCTAVLEAAVVEPDRVHSLAILRVGRSAPPVAFMTPLRFVALRRCVLLQQFSDDVSQARSTYFTAASPSDVSQAREVNESTLVAQSDPNASLCNTLSDASMSTAFATLGTVYRAQLAASELREAESYEHEREPETETAAEHSTSSMNADAHGGESDTEGVRASEAPISEEGARVRHASGNETDSITSVTSANELNAEADSASPNEENDEAAFSEEVSPAENEDEEAMSTIKQAPL